MHDITNQATNQPQATASNITGTSHSFANLPQGTYLLTVSDGTSTSQFDNIEVGTSAQSCVVDAQFLNQSAASVSLLGYSQFDNTTGVIGINGTFTIDADFTIDGAEIIMGPGAIIDILPGKTLTITNGAHLHGCCEMWEGIVVNGPDGVNDGATLIVENCIVEDGINAVDIKDQAVVTLKLNMLNRNRVSINFNDNEPGGSCECEIIKNKFQCLVQGSLTHLLPPYENNYSYAGIESNNFDFVLGKGNKFYGLNYGIKAKNSNMYISPRNYFERIRNLDQDPTPNSTYGSGIYATSDSDPANPVNYNIKISGDWDDTNIHFLNTLYGINTFNYINLSVSLIKMKAVNRGITVKGGLFNDVTINQCDIAASKSCVQISNLEMYNTLHISRENRFKLHDSEGNGNVDAVSIEGCTTNAGSGEVLGNEVYVNKARGGIYINASNNITCIENYAYLLESTPVKNKFGFRVTESFKINLQCNHVEGLSLGGYTPNGGNNIVNFYPRAYEFLDNSSLGQNIISCNQSRMTHRGMHFGGLNTGLVRGNAFGLHMQGLFYEAGANTDIQNLSGNKWHEEYGAAGNLMIGALNVTPISNTFYYQSNRYFINNYTDQFSPKRIRIKNATGNGFTTFEGGTIGGQPWFQLTSGDEFECLYNVGCKAPVLLVTHHDDAAYLATINWSTLALQDSLLQHGASSFQRWAMQQSLSHRIMSDSTLLANPVVQQWYEQAQNGSAFRYASLDASVRSISILSAADSLQLAHLNGSRRRIDTTLSNIVIAMGIEANQNALNQLTAQRYLYVDSLRMINAQLNDWLFAYKQQHQIPDSVISNNQSLIDTALYEFNAKKINEVYLSTLARGLFTFNENQKTLISWVAYQCPHYGGNAVYKARAMYKLINDTVTFDDDAICYSFGYRNDEASDETSSRINTYNVYPNPNNGQFVLASSVTNKMIGATITITVTDVLGRMVYSNETRHQPLLAIDLSHLSQGLYHLIVNENNQAAFKTNISIIK